MEDSRKLTGRLGLRFPLLSDPGLRVIAAYGVAMAGRPIAVPAVFVVDRDRKILHRHIGTSVTDRPSPEAILAHLR